MNESFFALNCTNAEITWEIGFFAVLLWKCQYAKWKKDNLYGVVAWKRERKQKLSITHRLKQLKSFCPISICNSSIHAYSTVVNKDVGDSVVSIVKHFKNTIPLLHGIDRQWNQLTINKRKLIPDFLYKLTENAWIRLCYASDLVSITSIFGYFLLQ